jgi:CubicO group peptidase (beta-lactamase class C family)
MRGETIVLEVASGVADERSALACAPEIRFQLASVSKQFTAAAILVLADEGRLSVDDPVTRWITGCPSTWSTMTIHHLLTHTAGLPHWWDVIPGMDLTSHMDPEAEQRLFQATPLRGPPGDSWYYSSPGYVLLAHIVQRAADQPYRLFLDEHLFDPLGMTSTFAGNASGRDRLARGYADGAPAPSFELDVVGMGAGDVWSTVGDVARWDAALAAGAVLGDVSRQAMLNSQAVVTGSAADETGLLTVEGYGYGWFIGTSLDRRVIYHPGDNAGFVALNAWFPDDDMRLVVLSNEETTDLEALLPDLLAELAS